MDLVSEWRTVDVNALGQRILECDREVLKRRRPRDLEISCTNWQAVLSDPCSFEGGNRLHLNRVPVPYTGNLDTASIFILSLNPGHELVDYYFEFEDENYLRALKSNLVQKDLNCDYPFFPLDPRFSKTGAYSYWFAKFRMTISRLMLKHQITFDEAHSELARKVAVIQLVAYASADSRPLGNLSRGLSSSRLAKKFVKDHVAPRVRSRKAIAIVLRGLTHWQKALPEDLTETDGLIRYDPKREARSASLSPSSPGGRAIIEWFCRSRQ